MEPISALSIACGVIQFLDVGAKVLSKFREIYKDGSTAEHAELRATAEHLITIQLNDLSVPRHIQAGQSNLSAADKELIAVAQRCSTIAKTLVDELRSLEANTSGSWRKAVKTTFKVIKKRSEIDGLQKQLDKYRQLMDTKLLLGLRWVRNLNLWCEVLIANISSYSAA